MIYSNLILVAAKKPNIWEKVQYLINLVATFGPVALLLKDLDAWFTTNANFIAGVVVALVINIVVGWWYHSVMKTFSWNEFFKGNGKMFFVVFVVYILLELLRFAMGNNIIGEGFKIIVQVSTILYPVSKALKNIHILTHKKHPPAAIMDRLYNFEKTGNVKELYNQKDDETDLNNVG